MIGLAAAAVVQQAMGTPSSATLWLGAFVASGVPDLDVLLQLVGKSGPRFHRNASHSLFFCGGLIALIWVGAPLVSITLDVGVLLAWLAALLTHPLVDYVTTGPSLGKVGYGIALFWPLSTRRFFSSQLVFARDRAETKTVKGYVVQAGEEITRLGPIAFALVVIALLV